MSRSIALACTLALAAGCAEAPSEQTGSRQQAAAGTLAYQRWPDYKVRYYIDPNVQYGFLGPTDPPQCTPADLTPPAAPAGHLPCILPLRDRIIRSLERYQELIALDFVNMTPSPGQAMNIDLADPHPHLIYTQINDWPGAYTQGYAKLREKFEDWRDECEAAAGCDPEAEPSDPEDKLAFRFAGDLQQVLRPASGSRPEDMVIVFQLQLWETMEGFHDSYDPGYVHTPLHETGHALGMMHEVKRPDATSIINKYVPCNTSQPDSTAFDEQPEAVKLSPYDITSVMQYASTTKCVKYNGQCFLYPILAKFEVPGVAETLYPQFDCDGNISPGYIIKPSGNLSPEDLNILYQMYPANLGYNEPQDKFGAAVAAGDFDGDGYDDLAIGAPGEQAGSGPQSGSVYIFKGTYSGLVPWRRLDEPNGRDLDGFGSALAAGDIDKDGKEDLVVGAPMAYVGTVRAGAVFRYSGSELGPRAPQRIDVTTVGFPVAPGLGDTFGSALVIADFNAPSATRELAIGAPGRDYVFVVSEGLQPFASFNGRPPGLFSVARRFGAALAAGRLNGDTIDDLAIGAPGSATAGSVAVSFGAVGSPMTAPITISEPVTGTANANGDEFGAALVVGRFASGSARQLVAGAPGHNHDKGRAYVLSVSASGATLVQTLRYSDVAGESTLDDARFGAAMTRVIHTTNVNDDLAVGASGTVGGAVRYGTVIYYVGGNQATVHLDASQDVVEHPHYHDGSGLDQRFGAAMAAGDFNNRGNVNLAVAVPGKTMNTGAVWVAFDNPTPLFHSSDSAGVNFATFLDQDMVYRHWVP